jgi:hypothetical protein
LDEIQVIAKIEGSQIGCESKATFWNDGEVIVTKGYSEQLELTKIKQRTIE